MNNQKIIFTIIIILFILYYLLYLKYDELDRYCLRLMIKNFIPLNIEFDSISSLKVSL